MCGVIGYACERHRADLGQIAALLLETLEYRGYDSTGAAVQGEGLAVTLRKGVGAPSAVVEPLGITRLAGSVLCGQVRWATFGAVDGINAQPHVMACKQFLYGAHNGNVTNSDALKSWLESAGHDVKSDNDGEMVVHTVEEHFAEALAALEPAARGEPEPRRRALRDAVASAAARLEGSFAAVVVDRETRTLYAVKSGSSLYFGIGADEQGGAFRIASSDLSAVLKLTRTLVPLVEGEFVEFTATAHRLFRIERRGHAAGWAALEREPVRSRLRALDTALVPPFRSFMEQEIAAQEQTLGDVVALFQGGSAHLARLAPELAALGEEDEAVLRAALEELRGARDQAAVRAAFRHAARLPAMAALLERLPRGAPQGAAAAPASGEAELFQDLLEGITDPREALVAHALDALLEQEEVAEHAATVQRFVALCLETLAARGRLYVVACGTSHHAALAAALFFAEIAGVELAPALPGEFRGRHLKTLGASDLVISVSQSGETKDLIDVLNDVARAAPAARRIGVVNNLNSTLALEKSDLVLPLRCGAEVAVPATKSFMNQLALFYCLALRLARARLAAGARLPDAAALDRREAGLGELPRLVARTLEATRRPVAEVAERLHLAPSMQILATRLVAVAKEGALKVREVVLNHTEGFEGSEFKHGPNTILGFNTVLGLGELDRAFEALGRQLEALLAAHPGPGAGQLARAAVRAVLHPEAGGSALEPAIDRRAILAALGKQYPLLYITGPDPRDVALTVSQINTHKIRGASTVVIAEEDAALLRAAQKAPAGHPDYWWSYLPLPSTGDPLLAVFSATVVLQRLALEMSLRKAATLDRLGVKDHGVHPDVPKNVSKSITVD